MSSVRPLPAAEAAIASIRQERPVAFSVLQLTRNDRDRLNRAREVILRQWQELQAKLEAIDTELRAIAAYEEAK